jgi:hypothetical protein
MTAPECTDPASAIITDVMNSMRAAFDPDSPCPPLGGGSTNVRFFTWQGAPLSAWDAHNEGGENCDEPFLWVRLDSRYRTTSFPTESIDQYPCESVEVIPLELGVGRCSRLEAQVDWADLAAEAEVSLDDTWRLMRAMRAVCQKMVAQNYLSATDTLVPYGPEGGITAWSGMLYVGFE